VHPTSRTGGSGCCKYRLKEARILIGRWRLLPLSEYLLKSHSFKVRVTQPEVEQTVLFPSCFSKGRGLKGNTFIHSFAIFLLPVHHNFSCHPLSFRVRESKCTCYVCWNNCEQLPLGSGILSTVQEKDSLLLQSSIPICFYLTSAGYSPSKFMITKITCSKFFSNQTQIPTEPQVMPPPSWTCLGGVMVPTQCNEINDDEFLKRDLDPDCKYRVTAKRLASTKSKERALLKVCWVEIEYPSSPYSWPTALCYSPLVEFHFKDISVISNSISLKFFKKPTNLAYTCLCRIPGQSSQL